MSISNQLLHYLPPFASDYSGVASALFGMGGMTIFCDAGCCTDHYVFCDEPRWARRQEPVFSSTLRTVEAVMGCDETVVDKCVSIAETLPEKPAFVALVGTPVPAIVGMDMRGVACEVEETLGVPALGFDMTGFRFYDHGVVMAATRLIERFAPNKRAANNAPSNALRVNLLGMTPFDFGDVGNVPALIEAFADAGFAVNVCLPGDASVEDLERIDQADANVALTASGEKIAQLLQKRYGTPYVVGCPFGPRAKDQLASIRAAVFELAKGTRESGLMAEAFLCNAQDDSDQRILVIGDQIIAQSLRANYAALYPDASIAVASAFSWNKAHARPCDFTFKGEFDLCEKAPAFRPTLVVGDPLFAFLVNQVLEEDALFEPFVHPAISGKLHWDDMQKFIQ